MKKADHIGEHLLLQYLLGKLDEREKGRVESWLKKSGSNRKLLDRIEALWLETGKLNPPPVAVDTAAAWKRVSERIGESSQKTDTRPAGRVIPFRMIRWVAGIAAILLVAFCAWWLTGIIRTGEKMHVITSLGEVVKDTLPDGSSVSLNAHSNISFTGSFGGQNRTVRLVGEAYFDVTHDPEKPFIVSAGSAGVCVLGTSFDVRAYPGRPVEVNVVSGKVLFFSVLPPGHDSSSIVLTKGMRGTIHPQSGIPIIEELYVPDDLFWLDRTIRFRQTPLSEVIPVLERRFHITVGLSKEALGSCRLTASFSGEPIEIILRVIADTFSLTLVSENGNYLLTGNECSDENH